MNVASLNLCKELYELSGWEYTYFGWYFMFGGEDGNFVEKFNADADNTFGPAYDLGYLLRKLPEGISIRHINPASGTASYWAAEYVPHDYYGAKADDTPEDALCLLAIQLFKQGILTKEAA